MLRGETYVCLYMSKMLALLAKKIQVWIYYFIELALIFNAISVLRNSADNDIDIDLINLCLLEQSTLKYVCYQTTLDNCRSCNDESNIPYINLSQSFGIIMA